MNPVSKLCSAMNTHLTQPRLSPYVKDSIITLLSSITQDNVENAPPATIKDLIKLISRGKLRQDQFVITRRITEKILPLLGVVSTRKVDELTCQLARFSESDKNSILKAFIHFPDLSALMENRENSDAILHLFLQFTTKSEEQLIQAMVNTLGVQFIAEHFSQIKNHFSHDGLIDLAIEMIKKDQDTFLQFATDFDIGSIPEEELQEDLSDDKILFVKKEIQRLRNKIAPQQQGFADATKVFMEILCRNCCIEPPAMAKVIDEQKKQLTALLSDPMLEQTSMRKLKNICNRLYCNAFVEAAGLNDILEEKQQRIVAS